MVSLLAWRKRQRPKVFAKDLAQRIGVARLQQVLRYEMPFGAPEHRIPRPDIMRRIFLVTGGEVEPNDFYPVALWRAELAANDDLDGGCDGEAA